MTNEKPKYYQVNDINTLIHNVTHTYHPNITEPIPQTNYSVPPNHDTFSTTQSLYNVQPTSHTSKPRVFSSLPYSPEILKFINKFNFQFSDLTNTEYVTLCNLLLK